MALELIELRGDSGADDQRDRARVKLAIQRNGRLTESTLDLLRHVGLEFESYGQRLFTTCRNFPLDIMFARDDDIPEYVASGAVDLGVVGRNLLYEEGVEADEILPLEYGYCSLVVAVPGESGIRAFARAPQHQSRALVGPLACAGGINPGHAPAL